MRETVREKAPFQAVEMEYEETSWERKRGGGDSGERESGEDGKVESGDRASERSARRPGHTRRGGMFDRELGPVVVPLVCIAMGALHSGRIRGEGGGRRRGGPRPPRHAMAARVGRRPGGSPMGEFWAGR